MHPKIFVFLNCKMRCTIFYKKNIGDLKCGVLTLAQSTYLHSQLATFKGWLFRVFRYNRFHFRQMLLEQILDPAFERGGR